jgi:hypothetical protein
MSAAIQPKIKALSDYPPQSINSALAKTSGTIVTLCVWHAIKLLWSLLLQTLTSLSNGSGSAKSRKAACKIQTKPAYFIAKIRVTIVIPH